MRFTEAQLDDYRIYAGALESPRGQGYTAALVVCRQQDQGARAREAFRDDQLACGYCWPTADEALLYAMNRARELIRLRSKRLAC